MKLKHKKLIVIIALVVIGIGVLIFSMNQNSDQEASGNNTSEDGSENGESLSAEENGDTEDTTEEETEAEPELALNADPEVVELVSQYMNAKLEPSVEAFTPLVSDISLIDIEAIDRETATIERYDNINIYSIDTLEEGQSLIYVSYDIKIVGIETPAPAATRFLVIKEADKAPYISNGEISEETNEFIATFEETNTYKEFIEGVDTRLQEALEQDENLAGFYAKLYETATEPPEETTAPAEETAAVPEETTAPVESESTAATE